MCPEPSVGYRRKRPDKPSLFNLPEIRNACGPEAISTMFYQCSVGAKSS